MTSDEPQSSAASLRNALVQVDEEIEEWNAHLLQLQQKRTGICTRLDAVVYPVLSLPVEITTEIFKHYVAGVVVWVGGSNSGRGPSILAAVCRAWRAIALNAPALWADICLQGSDSASQREKTQQMLESYLSRSAQHPLTVDATYIDLRGSLLRLLVDNSARWEDFSCGILSPAVLPGERFALPQLRKLWITADSDLFEDPPPLGPIAVFSEAPALRTVHLSEISFEAIVLPWTQLTELTLVGYPARFCGPILTHTTSLYKLCLQDAYSNDAMPTSSATIPSVTQLEVIGATEASLEILEFIALPGLKHLDIRIPEVPYRYNQLLEFAVRSGCALESFTIDDVKALHPSEWTDPTGVGLHRLLEHTSTLKKLNLTGVDWMALNRFLERMMRLRHPYPGCPEDLLPNLEELEIQMERTQVPYMKVAHILRDRMGKERATGPSLHRFRLHIPDVLWNDREGKQILHEMISEQHDIVCHGIRVHEVHLE